MNSLGDHFTTEAQRHKEEQRGSEKVWNCIPGAILSPLFFLFCSFVSFLFLCVSVPLW